MASARESGQLTNTDYLHFGFDTFLIPTDHVVYSCVDIMWSSQARWSFSNLPFLLWRLNNHTRSLSLFKPYRIRLQVMLTFPRTMSYAFLWAHQQSFPRPYVLLVANQTLDRMKVWFPYSHDLLLITLIMVLLILLWRSLSSTFGDSSSVSHQEHLKLAIPVTLVVGDYFNIVFLQRFVESLYHNIGLWMKRCGPGLLNAG